MKTRPPQRRSSQTRRHQPPNRLDHPRVAAVAPERLVARLAPLLLRARLRRVHRPLEQQRLEHQRLELRQLGLRAPDEAPVVAEVEVQPDRSLATPRIRPRSGSRYPPRPTGRSPSSIPGTDFRRRIGQSRRTDHGLRASDFRLQAWSPKSEARSLSNQQYLPYVLSLFHHSMRIRCARKREFRVDDRPDFP